MQLAREDKTINSWTSKVVDLVPTDYVVWWPNNYGWIPTPRALTFLT